MEPGKRHALRAHIPEAATDWLNLLSLGTMSASLKSQSHRHDAQPAHWKSSNFCQCVVVRWVCVTMRYSCVERAGPTLCIRRRLVCASGFFVHAQKCARSSTHEFTRQRCAERAGPTPDTRAAPAEHTLGMRCVFVD